MPKHVHPGLKKNHIERMCLLAEAMEASRVPYTFSVYPQTVVEYERCKLLWAAFKEDKVNSTARMLVYKNVTVYCPTERRSLIHGLL